MKLRSVPLPSKKFIVVMGSTFFLGLIVVIGLALGGGGQEVEYNAQKHQEEQENQPSLSSFMENVSRGNNSAEQDQNSKEAEQRSTSDTPASSGAGSNDFSPSLKSLLADTKTPDDGSNITAEFQLFLADQDNLDEKMSTEAGQGELVQAFMEESSAKEEVISFTRYSEEDVTLADDDNTESHQSYLERVNRIFEVETKGERKDEYALYQKAREAQSQASREQYFSEIREIQSRYDAIRNALLTTKVPESLLEHHLGMINGISMIYERIEGMLALSTDPVRAMINASAYPTQAQVFIRSYQGLAEEVKQNT